MAITDSKLKKLSLQVLGISEDFGEFDDETNSVVEKINFGYESLICQSLSEYRWSFATDTIQLTEKEVTNDYKFKYSYTLPTNFLVLINPFSDKERSLSIGKYEIKNKFYSNNETVYINYIKRIETELFPEHFIQYLKYKIAFDKCMLLTGDTDLLQTLNAKAREQYVLAKRIDAKQQAEKVVKDNPFYYARF